MNSIEEFKEKVKAASSITEVVAETLTLKHGKALCPFHPENTPSFSVNEKGGYFHCFGCGKGGDVITYVMLRDQKTFIEAVVYLANRTGIQVPDFKPENKAQVEEDRIVQDILGATVAFYHQQLSLEAREYLNGRGFTDETIDQFSLGYAGGGLREHLMSVKGFPGELCVKAGVLMEGENGTLRDRFYKRVLFPNFRRGRVVNISGRTLDDSEPKYLHLPGRLEHLFNEDVLLEHKTVFIAEGAVDCITLAQSGYPVVAVLGANNFKPEDAVKFSHSEEVFICLDGDKAGREGAVKIAGLLQDKARIAAMPEGEDINDYFRTHVREDFEKLVAGAKDFVTHLIDEVPADASKTQLPRLLDSVLRLLAKMDKAKAEPYLAYVIKPRFGLKDPDIRGYRDMVNKYRGEITRKANNDDGKPLVFSAHCEGLIDVVEEDGKPMFLVKSGDDLEIMAEVETDARILIPPPREQLPWLLANASEVKRAYEEEKNLSLSEADARLFDALVAYHRSISQLPSDAHYYLMAAWDIHTYLLEKFQYSPIICLFAVPERGKSRTGKALIYVAYRGIHVESLRDAYLVRVANDLGASVFFDVMNIWQKAEKNQSEDILLHRFEKGARVPRVNCPEKGAHQDITYYVIFGPTIIGTNEAIHRILETRAVNINMPETTRKFENTVTPQLALPLKTRLLAFRARHLHGDLPDMLKPAAGRLGDILKPLLQVVRLVRPQVEEDFLFLVHELERDRMVEKAESLEAQVLSVLLSLKEAVVHGVVSVKAITDRFNHDRPEKARLTYQRVGRRLTAMGFKKARGSDGGAVILWDDDMLARLSDRYGLEQTSETSERPEAFGNGPGVTDVSDETDVFSRAFGE